MRTTERTYGRVHFEEARRLWASGEFSDEWRDVRHAAAMRGFIYPPEGTKWDNWGDDEPTQRAILIRAIREQPTTLMAAINRSRSWHDVIGQIVANNERIGEDISDQERHERQERMENEPTQAQARQILKGLGL